MHSGMRRPSRYTSTAFGESRERSGLLLKDRDRHRRGSITLADADREARTSLSRGPIGAAPRPGRAGLAGRSVCPLCAGTSDQGILDGLDQPPRERIEYLKNAVAASPNHHRDPLGHPQRRQSIGGPQTNDSGGGASDVQTGSSNSLADFRSGLGADHGFAVSVQRAAQPVIASTTVDADKNIMVVSGHRSEQEIGRRRSGDQRHQGPEAFR